MRRDDLSYVRDNLHEVLRFTPGIGEKSVLDEVQAGRCEYLIGRVSGERCGFMVYSVRDTGVHLDLYVVCVWSERPLDEGAFNFFVNELKGLARQRGCSTISFHSPRRGWLRKLKRYGFAEVPQITMRCSLEDN